MGLGLSQAQMGLVLVQNWGLVQGPNLDLGLIPAPIAGMPVLLAYCLALGHGPSKRLLQSIIWAMALQAWTKNVPPVGAGGLLACQTQGPWGPGHRQAGGQPGALRTGRIIWGKLGGPGTKPTKI